MTAYQSELRIIKTEDTLRFKLFAQKIIPQSDARLTVEVHTLISGQLKGGAAVEQQIRAVLSSFVEAEWAFSTIKRTSDAAGYERLQLNASARVAISEIHNLENRARLASVEGISLRSPEVNYSLPSEKISDTVQELRRTIIQDAMRQTEEVESITARNWRIGDIVFGARENREEERFSKGGYRSSNEDIADLWADCAEAGMASAERITLIAEVTLCTPPICAGIGG